MRWVDFDKKERNDHLEKLILLIDFKKSGTEDIHFLEKILKEVTILNHYCLFFLFFHSATFMLSNWLSDQLKLPIAVIK